LAAQGEFPPIPKTKTATKRWKQDGGGWGEFTYKYADLADVLSTCCPVLSRHGLAVSDAIWCEGEAGPENRTHIEAELIHVSGQAKRSRAVVCKTEIADQDVGAALSYKRRYLICGLLGVSPDKDPDGRVHANGNEYVPKSDTFDPEKAAGDPHEPQESPEDRQKRERLERARAAQEAAENPSPRQKTFQMLRDWVPETEHTTKGVKASAVKATCEKALGRDVDADHPLTDEEWDRVGGAIALFTETGTDWAAWINE